MEENSQTLQKIREIESSSQHVVGIHPASGLGKFSFGVGANVWNFETSSSLSFPSTSSNNYRGSPWAIKSVRRNINEKLKNKFQSLLKREANLLRPLNHENIIGFRSYLRSEDAQKCLAMEIGKETLGNLTEARFENNLGPFPAHIILKVAYYVAKALAYLHDENKLLHGDVKSFNILIKNNFEEIKLCDFGFSLSLKNPKLREKYMGTPIYSAPECQAGAQGPITSKADMFSLGLLLWEMITLYPPHTEGLLFEGSTVSDDSASPLDLESSCVEENFGTRPHMPLGVLPQQYSLVAPVFYACTEQNPEERPSASQLADMLEKLIVFPEQAVIDSFYHIPPPDNPIKTSKTLNTHSL